MVVALDFIAALLRERVRTGEVPAFASPNALLHLLRSGDLNRHLRRTWRWQAQARQTLKEELAPLAPHTVPEALRRRCTSAYI